MNLFDIIGPVMVGPSSSHTAGAVRIGQVARRLLEERPVRAEIGLHGSFLATGDGHGTKNALLAGLLGLAPDDLRVPDSQSLARQAGLDYSFFPVHLRDAHPNTALLRLTGESGRQLEVQISSVGGGRIAVNRLDGVPVDFSAESHTLVVRNVDRPGHLAQVTSVLSQNRINVATLHLYRDEAGGMAVMVIEMDQPVPQVALDYLSQLEGILQVTRIEPLK